MWCLVPTDEYDRKANKLSKKGRQEFKNMVINLKTFLTALNAGTKPQDISKGFIHPEPAGVLAFDQRGKGNGLKEYRLYVYPEEETKQLHLLTIGEKKRQNDDIQFCTSYVKDLTKEPNDGQSSKSESKEGDDDAQEG